MGDDSGVGPRADGGRPPHPDSDDPPPLGGDSSHSGQRGRESSPGLLPSERLPRMLTIVLLAALAVASAGVVAVAVVPPQTDDPFTEFYVIGANGTAADYPMVVDPGAAVTTTLGIENHEHGTVTYDVVGEWNDSRSYERNVTVADGEGLHWDPTVTAPEEPGLYRLRYHLHGGSGGDGPQSLRLWIRVAG